MENSRFHVRMERNFDVVSIFFMLNCNNVIVHSNGEAAGYLQIGNEMCLIISRNGLYYN